MPLPLQPLCPHPSWLPCEDEQLRAAVAHVGFRDWCSVSRYFGGIRSALDYKSRWHTLILGRRRSDHTVRRPWTSTEDTRLQELVDDLGVGQWRSIALRMPSRSNKQCCERWRNHLDPAIRRAPWTPDEDALIVRLQTAHGNRWSVIAQWLPGRTSHAVRSRWHFHLKLLLAPEPQQALTSDTRQDEQGDKSQTSEGNSGSVLDDAALVDAVIQSLEEDDGWFFVCEVAGDIEPRGLDQKILSGERAGFLSLVWRPEGRTVKSCLGSHI